MIDYTKMISFMGEEYPYICTINILEKVQEKYGTIEEWQRRALGVVKEGEKEKEPDIGELKWSWMEVINQGILIHNLERKEDQKHYITEEEAGVLLSEIGLTGAVQEIYKEFIRCLNGGKIKNT